MRTRKAQGRSKTEERRARILSFRPQNNAWNPTLDECLAMEADERRRKLDKAFARWGKVDTTEWVQRVQELAEEMTK